MVKSISYDQSEIIKWILDLHVKNHKIDCDPTYSIGNFYKNTGIDKPLYKMDFTDKTVTKGRGLIGRTIKKGQRVRIINVEPHREDDDFVCLDEYVGKEGSINYDDILEKIILVFLLLLIRNIWTLLIKKMDIYVGVGTKLNWLIKEIIWIIAK